MSIDTELARLTNAKAAIKAAIEGKGVTVPDGTLLDGMAALIEAIEAGGYLPTLPDGYALECGTITPAESTNRIYADLKNKYIPTNGSKIIVYTALDTGNTSSEIIALGGYRLYNYTGSSLYLGIYSPGNGTIKSTAASYYPTNSSTYFQASTPAMGSNYYLAGVTYFWLVIGEVA